MYFVMAGENGAGNQSSMDVVAALPGDASGITKHGSVDIILPCKLVLVV